MRAAVLLCLLLLSPATARDDSQVPSAQLSVRDHERVRAAVARGEMVPLASILADAQRRYPGKVLEVELEGAGDREEYEVEILGDDGVIMELEYDARSGELLDIEVEED